MPGLFKKFCQIFLVCSISLQGLAATMSLEDCYRAAKDRYEVIGQKAESIVQADENHSQAVGALLPTITGNGSFFWQQDVPGSGGQSVSPPYQPTIGVSLTQPLFQGQLFNGLKLADAQYKQTQHDKKYSEVQLYQNIAATYYSILSQEKDIENLETELRFYDERILELHRYLKIGRAQMTDVLSVQTNRSQVLASILNEKGQLAAAREQVALYTGVPSDAQLDPNIEPLPTTVEPLETYNSKRDDREDVQRDRLGIEAADQSVWIAKEGHLPSVSLKADDYLQRYGIYDQVQWDVGIYITIPIFEGGITQSKVRQAVSLRESARLTSSLTERSGDEEIRSTYKLVAANLAQIEELKNYVKLGKATFDAEKHDFRYGLVRNIDVLQALTAYIDSIRTLDTARYNLKANLAHLQAASAFDLEKK